MVEKICLVNLGVPVKERGKFDSSLAPKLPGWYFAGTWSRLPNRSGAPASAGGSIYRLRCREGSSRCRGACRKVLRIKWITRPNAGLVPRHGHCAWPTLTLHPKISLPDRGFGMSALHTRTTGLIPQFEVQLPGNRSPNRMALPLANHQRRRAMPRGYNLATECSNDTTRQPRLDTYESGFFIEDHLVEARANFSECQNYMSD